MLDDRRVARRAVSVAPMRALGPHTWTDRASTTAKRCAPSSPTAWRL